MSTVSSYEEMVELLARSNSPDIINNSSTEHASVLIKGMLTHAKETVDLFTGCLDTIVYDKENIIDAGKHFVARGGKIRIVLQDPDAEKTIKDHPFVKALQSVCKKESAYAGKISIFQGSAALSKMESHFLVMDKKGYRFETDIKKHEACASFNGEEIATTLNNLFEGLLQNSNPVVLN